MGLRSGRTLQPSVPSQETTAGPVPKKKTKVVPPILPFDQVQRRYEQEREKDLKRQYPPKITPAATSPTPAPVVPQRQAWSANIRAQVNRLLRKDPTKLSTPEQFEADIRALQVKSNTLKRFLISPDWKRHNRALERAITRLDHHRLNFVLARKEFEARRASMDW
jgi:hypothetical protein